MKPAAQYLRMSSDEQRYSIANQIALIGDYAARQGYQIIRSYVDAGRSGVTTAGREGLKALLGDVLAKPEFVTVLVTDVSRWGRYQDPDEGAHYEHLCREAGVRVEYCAEPFDDDETPASALIKNLKRVMAGEYSRQLSDRCRAGLRRAIETGRSGGGPATYGFMRQAFDADGRPGPILRVGDRRSRIDQHVRIVPAGAEELRTVQRIFALFVEGRQGIRAIARALNDAGAPHRDTRGWTDERVRSVLRDERLTGVFVFNRTHSRFGALDHIERDQWRRVRVGDPVIALETFAAARRKLTRGRGVRITDEEMIEKLGELLAAKGALSRELVRAAPGVPNVSTYHYRFGSLAAAFARLGVVAVRRNQGRPSPRRIPSEAILASLRRLYEKHGYLSAALIAGSPDVPHLATIRRRFGGLEQAYARVGFTGDRAALLRGGWVRRKRALARRTAPMDAAAPRLPEAKP